MNCESNLRSTRVIEVGSLQAREKIPKLFFQYVAVEHDNE